MQKGKILHENKPGIIPNSIISENAACNLFRKNNEKMLARGRKRVLFWKTKVHLAGYKWFLAEGNVGKLYVLSK
jgi:hypothetical protein